MDTIYKFLEINSTQKKITIASNKIEDKNFLAFKFPESEYYIPLEFYNTLFSKVIETGKFGNQRIYDVDKKGFDGLVLLSLRFRVEIDKVMNSEESQEEKSKIFDTFYFDLVQYLKIYCKPNSNIIFEDSRENTSSIPSHISYCVDDIFSTFELRYLSNPQKDELGEEIVNFVIDNPFQVDVDLKLIAKYFSAVGLFKWEESFIKEKLNSKDTFNWFFLGGVLPLSNSVYVSKDLYKSLSSRFIDDEPLIESSDGDTLPPKLKMKGSLEKKKRFIANLTFVIGYYQTVLELANNINSPILITESNHRQAWKDIVALKEKMDKDIKKLNPTAKNHIIEIITLYQTLILNQKTLSSPNVKKIAREVNYTFTWHLYQFLLKEGNFVFDSKKDSKFYDALTHAISEIYAIIKLGNTIGVSAKEDKDRKQANWGAKEWGNTKTVIGHWLKRYEKDYKQ